jgi:Holliday junction resolvasome RuvABC endonuclease subunit
MDRLTVLGLDVSLTSTGGAKVTGGALGGDPWLFRVQSKRKGIDRLDSQVTRIGQAIERCEPDLIALEGPALHGTGAYYHENAGLHWAVRLAIHRSGMPLAVITPATLKKFGTGKGNASKLDMCVAAVKRFDLDTVQEDEADALWLAAATLQQYGLPLVSLPAAQVEALVKVDWPLLRLAALSTGLSTIHRRTPPWRK